ncbi:MAG: hypothetical protein V3T16_01975 [Gemmatimonadales bacterium]
MTRTGSSDGEPFWAHYSGEELLRLRFADLGIGSPGPWLESCLDGLFGELADRNLRLRPRVWLSDEWFSPDGVAGMALPFYLTHPRLKRLEHRMMHGVEGGTRTECLQLLRHETAHALQHAYRFERRAEWRRVFGRSSTRYPDRYRPDPTSRAYVHHLRDWYAQCHPDEDFAETFAVWLAPGTTWRKRYREWPVLRKLEYVDRLMTEIAAGPVPRASRRAIDPLVRLRTTLGEHYRARRARFTMDRPTPLDEPLARLLGHDQARRQPRARRGATVLRQRRSEILALVAPATPEMAYAFGAVHTDLVGRSRTLDFRVGRSEEAIVRDTARLLRAHLHSLFHDPSTWEWIPV